MRPRFGWSRWPLLRWSLACLLSWSIVGNSLTVSACSVPVFRYALERWPPSPYELLLFHARDLNPAEQALADKLSSANLKTNLFANVSLRTVDLRANPAPDLQALWSRQTETNLPRLLLRYPREAAVPNPVWTGPLTEASLELILDSPARQEIARRLVKGDSAVWVLIETGDNALDQSVAAILEKRLAHLAKALKLPTIESEDTEVLSVPESALKIAFSLVRIARTNAAEQAFIRMLLGSEDDLAELKEAVAFPIFGRGRALFALVGRGINDELIDEACTFLTGPCSCVVKEENPGMDMLFAMNWEGAVTVQAVQDHPVPELTGLTAAAPLDSSPRPTNAAVRITATPASKPVPVAVAGSSNRLLRTTAWVLAGVCGLALAGGLFVLGRKRG